MDTPNNRMLNRRGFLLRSGALGCSIAASPLITPMTFASTPAGPFGDNRLVVIILRGAMDGLDVVRPVGDSHFAGLRPTITDPGLPLDGFYELHPALAPLAPLWDAGELGFAHAVATPYRDKRSHFDGQDLLEAGIADQTNLSRTSDGWLNRMITLMPGATAQTAFAVGSTRMAILSGDAPHSNWAPKTALRVSDQAERLLELVYHDDPLFRDAFGSADEILDDLETQDGKDEVMLSDMTQMGMTGNVGPKGLNQIVEFTLNRLLDDTRIASFSMGGWDVHSGQQFRMNKLLGTLAKTILAFKIGLGAQWSKTTVLAMTEFGRTVRENGTRGTDHGTGGALLMAGGAVNGGQVYGAWPGLSETDMYQRRDLMPTADVRAYAGHAMRGMFGLTGSDIERSVFPNLDLGQDPGIIL